MQGELALEEATASAITATRRYAKRQLTWLRSAEEFTPLVIDADDNPVALAERVEQALADRAISGSNR